MARDNERPAGDNADAGKSGANRNDSDRPNNNRGEKKIFNTRDKYNRESEDRRSFNGDRNEGSDRKSYGDRRESGERKSFGSGRRESGDRKPYSDRAKREGGERRSYGSDRREGGEKRSFGGDRREGSEKRSFTLRREDGERRSFGGDRREGGEKKPFTPRREDGDRKSFGPDRREGGERRSFGGDRRESGDRKPFGEGRREGENRKPFGDRREGGERRSFGGDRNEGSDRKSYGDRRESGERKSFGSGRRESGDRKPYSDRAKREGGERRSYGSDRREGGEKRSFGGDRREGSEKRSFTPRREDGERRSFRNDRREGGEKRSFAPRREEGERRTFDNDRTDREDNRPASEQGDLSNDKKPFKSERLGKEAGRGGRLIDRSRNHATETPNYNIKHYEDNPRIKKSNRKETEDDGTIRLNRYIANAGVCSRREADSLIEAGEIKVNGQVVTEMGYKVAPSDTVQYGKQILSREKQVYVLLNKPKDFITTTDDPDGRKTVMDLVDKASKERIFPVGRLDRNTTGLLLFTNDGELAQKLTHPSNNIKKIYQVELDKPITKEDFQKIVEGLELEDGKAVVDDLALVGDSNRFLGIEIHIGKNRIVRRIFEHLGYDVVSLDRVQYAGLTKKDLPRGNWRYISEKELVRLKYFV